MGWFNHQPGNGIFFLFSWLVGSHSHFTRRWTIESAPKPLFHWREAGGIVPFLLAIYVFFCWKVLPFTTTIPVFFFNPGSLTIFSKVQAVECWNKFRIRESLTLWKNHLRVPMVGFYCTSFMSNSNKIWDSWGGGRVPGVFPGYLGISTFHAASEVDAPLGSDFHEAARGRGAVDSRVCCDDVFLFLVVGWCL